MARGNGGNASVADLVAKAEMLADQCQPELAVQFYERALQREPHNSALLDAVGELSLELDNPERALTAFQHSIGVAPTANPSKYLYVAQLCAGTEAEQFATQGVTLLQQELQQTAADSDVALVLKKQISEALCSMGELYMTDLCDEDDAEANCERYFVDAMNYDIGMPEPTQALANLRLTQQRKDDAVPLLEETYRRLQENCTDESLPPLEFRIFTGKLLIEAELYEHACDVLEACMQEDDENPELWFLVATCYRAMDDLSTSLEFFTKCEKMLSKLKKELRDEFPLDEQLESVVETIAALQHAVEARAGEEDEEDEDEDEESGEDADADGAAAVGTEDVDMDE